MTCYKESVYGTKMQARGHLLQWLKIKPKTKEVNKKYSTPPAWKLFQIFHYLLRRQDKSCWLRFWSALCRDSHLVGRTFQRLLIQKARCQPSMVLQLDKKKTYIYIKIHTTAVLCLCQTSATCGTRVKLQPVRNTSGISDILLGGRQ